MARAPRSRNIARKSEVDCWHVRHLSMQKYFTLFVLLTSSVFGRIEVLHFADSVSLIVEVKEGWHVEAPEGPRPGFPFTTFSLRPDERRNAVCLITVYNPNEERAGDMSFLRELLEADSKPWIDSAPGHKMSAIEELASAHVKGVSAKFVDSKLIGKPIKPRDYKTATSCIFAIDEVCLTKASVLCDDFKSKEFKEAMSMVLSLSVSSSQRI